MTSKGLFRNGLLCAVLAAGWGGAAWAAEVRGRVVLEDPVPGPTWVEIEPKEGAHSTQGCGSLKKASQRIRADSEGGLQDAVVWLESEVGHAAGGSRRSAAAPGAPEEAILDQRECVFEPHVVVLRPGGRLRIRNSDPVLHNIRIFREGVPSMLMHRWQKAGAGEIVWRFPEPGRYVVRCGVHTWMYARVAVIFGPAAAVTDGRGRFTLAGVPTGRHTLHVWHEALGRRKVPVTVEEGGAEVGTIRLGGVSEHAG